jgi:hypothetical protein
MNRRRWLASSAAAVAAPYRYSSRQARAAPSKNDRPIAAVIGSGGRGTSMVWHQFGHHAHIVAICDADLRRAEKSAGIIEEKLGRRPAIVQDYRRLLERNDIEVIGNATPDHWHTKINIDACRAGKDIYAEKPLTLTIDEGKQLRDVVYETKRILQVGSHMRSIACCRTACELVRNGRIGKLKTVGVLLPFNADCKSGRAVPTQPVPPEVDWDLWQGQAPEASTWWDLCDWSAGGKPTGLLHKDMTPKPAYLALKKLIKQQWWTSLEATTNAEGRISLRGFYGDYRVSIQASGKAPVVRTFTIAKGKVNQCKCMIMDAANDTNPTSSCARR